MLWDCAQMTAVFSLYDLMETTAEELVEDPEEAELIVSNQIERKKDGSPVIRSYEYEKVIALMEGKTEILVN